MKRKIGKTMAKKDLDLRPMKRKIGKNIAKKDPDLPFGVGQSVETRSFIQGFRGAWFRCEIKNTRLEEGCYQHMLYYYDFPDEEEQWEDSYEKIPWSKNRKRHLMLRPQYPPIYRSDQVPPISAISEVKTIVICDGEWRVGDLVDWFEKGCYWSGKVTQILGNEQAMVELMPPPAGEGSSYTASFSQLRPSLDWSQKDGWTVPTPNSSADAGNFRQCAQLKHLVNQAAGDQSVSKLPTESEGRLPSAEEMQIEPPNITVEVTGNPGTSIRTPRVAGESPKNVKASVEVPLNSHHEDSLEAALTDLEEISNKLTWLKKVLKFGMPLSNVVAPSWKFVEHYGSSLPK